MFHFVREAKECVHSFTFANVKVQIIFGFGPTQSVKTMTCGLNSFVFFLNVK